MLREARGVEVAPLKVKVVIILNFGFDSIGGSFLFYFRIFVGTFFSASYISQKVKVTRPIWSSIKEGLAVLRASSALTALAAWTPETLLELFGNFFTMYLA